MTKADDYRAKLRDLGTWESFLLDESGLPGPRANIDLGQAVADEGTAELFERLLAWTPDRAPIGSREEFLEFCGTLGLGRLLATGETSALSRLRELASDPRWRVREGVATALQRLGAAGMGALIEAMHDWTAGNHYEQRAVAAALCEPALLVNPANVGEVLGILDEITAALAGSSDRRGDAFRTLRQGLGYCWSVAVAAAPDLGRPAMERWLGSSDPDVRWVMRTNLTKKRLAATGPEWVATWQARVHGNSAPSVR